MPKQKKETITTIPENSPGPHRYQDKIDAWKRDEYGLLPNIEYHFKEDNRVDWRKMIPSKYLFLNKQKFPEGTDLSSLNVEEIEDSKLLISLAGAREILRIRGYSALNKTIAIAHESYAAMTCTINLIPNFESQGISLQYTGEANKHFGNTKGFGKDYLVECCGNCAEVRAIKNALGIEILGQDEINGAASPEPESVSNGVKPIDSLKNLCSNNKISFDYLKKRLIEDRQNEDGGIALGIEEWKSFDDIKVGQVYSLWIWTEQKIQEKKGKDKK